MKNLHQCSCWRICFLKKKIPTQAVRGAVGGQETKWKSETTTYYNHLHHHLLLLCQTSSTKSPNFIFPCAALTVTQISKLNEMLILNSLFAVHYLSVCLEPTVEVPRIKNTNLSKDSIQFCISHFLGTNTGLPTLSLSRSATSLSHSCDHDQLQHLDLLVDYLYNKILLPHRHHCDTQHKIRKRNSVGDISSILAY